MAARTLAFFLSAIIVLGSLGFSMHAFSFSFATDSPAGGLAVTNTVSGGTAGEYISYQVFRSNGRTPVNVIGKYSWSGGADNANNLVDATQGRFKLKNGEGLIITGLEPGDYVVKKLDGASYSTEYTVTGGEAGNTRDAAVTVTGGATTTISFVNTYVTGSLAVMTVVSGGVPGEYFNFRIFGADGVSPVDITGNYSWFNGADDPDNLVDTAQGQFKLKDSEGLMVTNLVPGDYYVKEIGGDDYTTTYRVTGDLTGRTKTAGATVAGGRATTVTFTNTFTTGGLAITNKVSSGPEDRYFSFRLYEADGKRPVDVAGRYSWSGGADDANNLLDASLGSFKLKNGESLLLSGFDPGVYVVKQSGGDGYDTTYSVTGGGSDAAETPGTSVAATVYGGEISAITFTSAFITGGLTVTKTVEGGPEDIYFEFQVLSDGVGPLDITGRYSWSGGAGDGPNMVEASSGRFMLKDGEGLVIAGLDPGNYIVREFDTDDYDTKYLVSGGAGGGSEEVSGSSAVAEVYGDAATTVAFTNTKKWYDAALRKWVSAVNGEATADVRRSIETAAAGIPSPPVKIRPGDIVEYTIRLFNQGSYPVYVPEIVNDLPEGFIFEEYFELPSGTILSNEGWARIKAGSGTGRDYLKHRYYDGLGPLLAPPSEGGADPGSAPGGDGGEGGAETGKTGEKGFADVKIYLMAGDSLEPGISIGSAAGIAKSVDVNGDEVFDFDSAPGEDTTIDEMKDNETGEHGLSAEAGAGGDETYNYIREKNRNPDTGEYYDEDDHDTAFVVIPFYDAALRIWASAVNGDSRSEDAPEQGIFTNPGIRRNAVLVQAGDIVEYTARVYNLGPYPIYVPGIVSGLPEGLTMDFEESEALNANNGGKWDNLEFTYANGHGPLLEPDDYTDIRVYLKVTETASGEIALAAGIVGGADEDGKGVEIIEPAHDEDSAKVILPTVSVEVDKDTIKSTRTAVSGGEGEYYRYDINFRSTSNVDTEEFVVEDPLEFVVNNGIRIEGFWTPAVWGDKDGRMNVWYKSAAAPKPGALRPEAPSGAGEGGAVTQVEDPVFPTDIYEPGTNENGWKLWRHIDKSSDDLFKNDGVLGSDFLELPDDLAEGDYITAIRLEYGPVKVGFTSKNYGEEIRGPGGTVGSGDSGGPGSTGNPGNPGDPGSAGSAGNPGSANDGDALPLNTASDGSDDIKPYRDTNGSEVYISNGTVKPPPPPASPEPPDPPAPPALLGASLLFKAIGGLFASPGSAPAPVGAAESVKAGDIPEKGGTNDWKPVDGRSDFAPELAALGLDTDRGEPTKASSPLKPASYLVRASNPGETTDIVSSASALIALGGAANGVYDQDRDSVLTRQVVTFKAAPEEPPVKIAVERKSFLDHAANKGLTLKGGFWFESDGKAARSADGIALNMWTILGLAALVCAALLIRTYFFVPSAAVLHGKGSRKKKKASIISGLLLTLTLSFSLALPITVYATGPAAETSGYLTMEYRLEKGGTPEIPKTVERFGSVYRLVYQHDPVEESLLPETRTYSYQIAGELTPGQQAMDQGLGNVVLKPVNVLLERETFKTAVIESQTNDVDGIPKNSAFEVTSGVTASGVEIKQLDLVDLSFELADPPYDDRGLPAGYIATATYSGIETYTGIGYYQAEATYSRTAENETGDPGHITAGATQAAQGGPIVVAEYAAEKPSPPLYGDRGPAGAVPMSFLSMILSAAGIFAAGMFTLRAGIRRRALEFKYFGVYNEAWFDLMKQRSIILRALTIIFSIIALLAWVFLDDLGLGLVWVNQNTPAICALFVITMALSCFANVREKMVFSEIPGASSF